MAHTRALLLGVCGQEGLLRLVRVAGVHGLEVDRAAIDVEPDPRRALQRRFVLPPLVRAVATQTDAEGLGADLVLRRWPHGLPRGRAHQPPERDEVAPPARKPLVTEP